MKNKMLIKCCLFGIMMLSMSLVLVPLLRGGSGYDQATEWYQQGDSFEIEFLLDPSISYQWDPGDLGSSWPAPDEQGQCLNTNFNQTTFDYWLNVLGYNQRDVAYEKAFEPGARDNDSAWYDYWWKPVDAPHTPMRRTDDTNITNDNLTNYCDPEKCQVKVGDTSYGYFVKFVIGVLNPDGTLDLSDICVDGTDARVQIINNLVFYDPDSLEGGYNMFTIYLPPYFNSIDNPISYPVLWSTCGTGGLNNYGIKYVGSTGDELADTACASYIYDSNFNQHEYGGCIVVKNSGGGRGSWCASSYYADDTKKMMIKLRDELNADVDKVITKGGSRGGAGAMLCAETEDDVYTVTAVFAGSPARGYGSLAQSPRSLVPSIGGFYSWLIDENNGEAYSNNPPPMSNPSPMIWVPAETMDPLVADARSCDGVGLANLAGKYLFLQSGTHDSLLGRHRLFLMFHRLSELGINHTALAILGSGHGCPDVPSSNPTETIRGNIYNDVVKKTMKGVFDPATYTPFEAANQNIRHGLFDNALTYWSVSPANRSDPDNISNISKGNVPYLENQSEIPFLVTLPYKLGRYVRVNTAGERFHEPSAVVLTGATGWQWNLTIRNNTGDLIRFYNGTFGVGGRLNDHFIPKKDNNSQVLRWGMRTIKDAGYYTQDLEYGEYEDLAGMDTSTYYTYEVWYETSPGMMADVSGFTNFYDYVSGEQVLLEPKTIIIDPVGSQVIRQPYSAEYLPVDDYWDDAKKESITLGIIWCNSLNSPPETPATPSGPSFGSVGVEYTFTTTTIDIDGDQVWYRWDWDDGTRSAWLGPYESGAIASASHSWSVVESYDIQVEARDRFGFESLLSQPHQINIDNNPPAPPIVTGPTEGIVGFDYEFSATTVDPDGNQILYQFFWDDETTSGWLGPYDSGEPAFASHTWVATDSYNVYVQAKDMFGGLSDPSKYHMIHITNHAPATPGAPQGPSEGETFEEYSFTAVSSDPDGHNLKYMFDWDDGTPLEWTGLYPSNTPVTANHEWVFSGYYHISVKVKDAYDAESGWSNPHTILINSPPLNPERPQGETHGEVGTIYTYITSATDPDGHQVRYMWDWGDEVSNWLGPYDSGVTAEASHTWTEQDTYNIRVKAKDIYDAESDWSIPLPVEMPVSYIKMTPGGQIVIVNLDVLIGFSAEAVLKGGMNKTGGMGMSGGSQFADFAWDLNGDNLFEEGVGCSLVTSSWSSLGVHVVKVLVPNSGKNPYVLSKVLIVV